MNLNSLFLSFITKIADLHLVFISTQTLQNLHSPLSLQENFAKCATRPHHKLHKRFLFVITRVAILLTRYHYKQDNIAL